jgi:hypothetical protein
LSKPPYDVEALSTAIQAELLQMSPVEVAETLSSTNREILFQLSSQRPSVVKKNFSTYLDANFFTDEGPNILETVHHLCIASLINSSYNGVVLTLEENIVKYLASSKKEQFQSLINSAQKLSSQSTQMGIENQRNQICVLNDMIAKITEALKLFYYVEEDSKECIEMLAAEIDGFGNQSYPLCRRHFKTLYQNLSILKNEKSELASLQKSIHEKLNSL